jgi:hypothetical protein
LARATLRALGEELFAESKKQSSVKKKLSAKNSSPRAKKITLGGEFFAESQKITLDEEFFIESIFSTLGEDIF